MTDGIRAARIVEEVLNEFFENQAKPVTDPTKEILGTPLNWKIITALEEKYHMTPKLSTVAEEERR